MRSEDSRKWHQTSVVKIKTLRDIKMMMYNRRLYHSWYVGPLWTSGAVTWGMPPTPTQSSVGHTADTLPWPECPHLHTRLAGISPALDQSDNCSVTSSQLPLSSQYPSPNIEGTSLFVLLVTNLRQLKIPYVCVGSTLYARHCDGIMGWD